MAYPDGEGTRRSNRWAALWLRRAAANGHAKARRVLRRTALKQVARAAGGKHAGAFLAGLDAFVEIFEHRQSGLLEFGFPVERTALGGGGAVGIHPVHAVFI